MTPQRANVFLLVILAFLLITLAVGGVGQMRTAARNTAILKGLQELASAAHQAHDTHKFFPPAFDKYGHITYPVSFHVHLLPYSGQKELYKKFLTEGQGPPQELVPQFVAQADTSAQTFA